jgi:hypothetical protein
MLLPSEDHSDCGSGRVEVAAEWYRQHRAECPRPIIPFMILNFGLSGPREAIEALRIATLGVAE